MSSHNYQALHLPVGIAFGIAFFNLDIAILLLISMVFIGGMEVLIASFFFYAGEWIWDGFIRHEINVELFDWLKWSFFAFVYVMLWTAGLMFLFAKRLVPIFLIITTVLSLHAYQWATTNYYLSDNDWLIVAICCAIGGCIVYHLYLKLLSFGEWQPARPVYIGADPSWMFLNYWLEKEENNGTSLAAKLIFLLSLFAVVLAIPIIRLLYNQDIIIFDISYIEYISTFPQTVREHMGALLASIITFKF